MCPVHRSYLDGPLAILMTKRRIRFLVKDTAFKSPFWAWLFDSVGFIPVNRGAPDRKSILTCLRELQAGFPLVLFPEGTRKDGPVVREINEGAAYLAMRAQVPVIPIGIGGSDSALPRGAKFIKRTKIMVVIGEPMLPSDGDSGRPSRVAIRAATDALLTRIQHAFDSATAEVARLR